MSLVAAVRETPVELVEAQLNYLNAGQVRPVNYAIEPPPGVPQRTGEVDARQVLVANARRLEVAPTLDVNGFQLVPHATSVTDFTDDASIRSTYYAEVEAVRRERALELNTSQPACLVL